MSAGGWLETRWLPVIVYPDAVVDPPAVVVEIVDTPVANFAVFRIIGHRRVTVLAVELKLLVVVLNSGQKVKKKAYPLLL